MSHPAAPYATAAPADKLPVAPLYTLPTAEVQAQWSEDRLQQECLLWLQGYHPIAARLIYHVPNGGKRSQVEAAKFQAIGVKAGVPDLCLPMSGTLRYTASPPHALYIELKRGALGSVSPAQRAYHALLRQARNRVEVVRSLPEFIALLTEYLA